MNVIILGASIHADRYSNMAQSSLLRNGHNVILVTPNYKEIEGIKTLPSISNVNEQVEVVTVYVNPSISSKLKDELLTCTASTFIFNPGSENPSVEMYLSQNGKKVIRACTLVLLSTGQFDSVIS